MCEPGGHHRDTRGPKVEPLEANLGDTCGQLGDRGCKPGGGEGGCPTHAREMFKYCRVHQSLPGWA